MRVKVVGKKEQNADSVGFSREIREYPPNPRHPRSISSNLTLSTNDHSTTHVWFLRPSIIRGSDLLNNDDQERKHKEYLYSYEEIISHVSSEKTELEGDRNT